MGLGVRSGRWEVSDGIVLFASAVLLLSLSLVMIDDAGTSAGAAAVPTSSHPALVQTQTSLLPAPTTTTTTVPPTTTTTTVPPTTTTTAPPATTTTTAPPPPPASTALPAKGQATEDGCSAALAYLSAYSAPGFTFECPGYALGHEAMTCINTAGVCSDEHLIAIADPCAVAYMNEASNSWVMTGASDAPIDPYGACP